MGDAINLEKPSLQSLHLEPRFHGEPLSSATGFVANGARGPVLMTNWHVVSGRNPATKAVLHSSGGIPNEIAILHNDATQIGRWRMIVERVVDADGLPLWFEHPKFRERVDVVALPLTNVHEVRLLAHTLGVGDPPLAFTPAEPISIVGFPFGRQRGFGGLAVWSTGFVASEPAAEYDGLPAFLVDCRGRPGQSGSPVLVYRRSGQVPTETGSASYDGPVSRFLGVYSGRINEQSDLGIVWKAIAVRAVAESTLRGNGGRK